MATTQTRTRKPRLRYNTKLLARDMALRGWNNTKLARAAGLSNQSITRFFSGVQSAPTAEKIARALGHTVERYLPSVEAVA